MAPSAVWGWSPLNQAITAWGDMAWASSCFSAAAWRRPERGQPQRSRRAWSSWKNDIEVPAESAMAQSTSLRAIGSERPALSESARLTSPVSAARKASRKFDMSSAEGEGV